MSSEGGLYDDPQNRLRHEAYSRLQAASVAFGERLPIPEIVAIGGQSDGKSSLLEAFLGFRFNIREVELGTKRPLIVQMVHDPTAAAPRCRLQEEDTEEYGPVITPETAIADAIRAQTAAHLAQTGGTVSAKPIVMRTEYAFCPDLTLIDTPGFILQARAGEPEATPQDILSMVKEQAAPPHRLILFLQQSSVEWCSSLWLHVVQEVDPTFQRTVVVVSKFDNRLKEFGERWEVDRYLSAAGYLAADVRPFFVALPKERSVTTSEEWRSAVAEVDASVLAHLRRSVAGGFDEERFGGRIGFRNLKRFLEEELARRYRDAAPATLALLGERHGRLGGELATLNAQLAAVQDVASLRRIAMTQVAGVARGVNDLLGGALGPDPQQHGMTTAEERAFCGLAAWPGVGGEVAAPNAGLRLYGGAAFNRVLGEFQEATAQLAFPPAAVERVALALLAPGVRCGGGGGAPAARAARDLARRAARDALGPLTAAAAARAAGLLRATFDAATAAPGVGGEVLARYVAFNAELRSSYHAYVGRLEAQCRGLLAHHIDAATSEFAVEMAAAAEDDEGDQENAAPRLGVTVLQPAHAHRTVVREALCESQMTVPETPSPMVVARKTRTRAGPRALAALEAGAGPNDIAAAYPQVCEAAERIFGRVRRAVAGRAAPTTLKAAFLEPLTHNLGLELALPLLGRSDADFMALFSAAGAEAQIQAQRDALVKRLQHLSHFKDEFTELARCL